MPNEVSFPLPFWLSCAGLAVGMLQGWLCRRHAWGLPCMAVMATTGVWYIGDALYNNYAEYIPLIGAEALDSAWWQVLVFITGFCVLAPVINGWVNLRIKHRRSTMMRFFETRRLEHPDVQRRINHAASGLFAAWAALMVAALVRVEGDFIGLFMPYLGHKAEPWSRGRIGGGFDAIISLASYVQVFLTAGAGVIWAVSRKPSTQGIALAICCLSFPYYIFDRTRNVMLATVLPGLLTWVFFRLRGGIVVKVAALAAAFLVVNAWFSFVLANRTDVTIAEAAVSEKVRGAGKGRHEGLNMFEELGWINSLMAKGLYNPNFGERYLAELANPIPRVIWKNKPEIGIDYAIARGQKGGNANSAGVFATISTGMIGQGVVNFGGFFGALASAVLMAGWVAVLARQDLLGADPARLLLYATGMTLTFNLGRDITLLVLYPFLFGWIMLKVYYYFKPQAAKAARPARRRTRKNSRATKPGPKTWGHENRIDEQDPTERVSDQRL